MLRIGQPTMARHLGRTATIDTDIVPMRGETKGFRDLVDRLKRRYPPQSELRLDSGGR